MKTVRNSNHLILLKKEINDLEVEKEQIKLSPTLVERAAKIIAEFTRNLATSQTRNIVIIAGAGNNGADAILAAKHLRDWFFDINLFVIKTQSTFSTNCLSALKTWNHALSDISTLNDCLHTSDLIVDGLLGIGLNRPLSGETLKIVHAINKLKKHIIAIDIPSGLDPDSGRVMGAAIKATNTVSLLALKLSLIHN